eukprot:scaffold3888_cov20-Tisochrysis_lutea.AAC.7
MHLTHPTWTQVPVQSISKHNLCLSAPALFGTSQGPCKDIMYPREGKVLMVLPGWSGHETKAVQKGNKILEGCHHLARQVFAVTEAVAVQADFADEGVIRHHHGTGTEQRLQAKRTDGETPSATCLGCKSQSMSLLHHLGAGTQQTLRVKKGPELIMLP